MLDNEIMCSSTIDEQSAAGFKLVSTLQLWRRKLANLVISSIEWHNLPPTIDKIYLERSLYYTGSVIFFEVLGVDNNPCLVCCRGFGTSLPNIYNIPLNRVVDASNGFHADLTNENSVICYNNVLRYASTRDALPYSTRLSQIDQVIDINTNAQKTPVMIRAAKNAELSVKNAFAQYNGNSPVIAVTKDFDTDSLSSLNLNAPFVAAELRKIQEDILTEFSISQGIASAGNFKAERMIESEIISNNSGVLVNRRAKLLPRQNACDYINQKFSHLLNGKKVYVTFAEDSADKIFNEGVENSGEIYADVK